ncbi:MAG: hypothetical protein P4L22_06320 [Candidatus Babeliales bacterium]|nr:hypothetical protein [Candidatus Babeliales bacterium]
MKKLILVIISSITLCNNILAGCKTAPSKKVNTDGSCNLKNKSTDCKKGYSCMLTTTKKSAISSPNCVKCAGKECDSDADCKKSGKGTTCYNGVCRTFVL